MEGQSQMTTSPSPDNQRGARQAQRRRRRIQTACKSCQDRKTRCDGRRPACSSCHRRGVAGDCTYDDSTVPASYISTLEQRLLRLEQRGEGTPSPQTPIEHNQTSEFDPTRINEYGGLPSLESRSPPAARVSSSVGKPSAVTQGTNDVDGLATVSSVDETECLYGASSTIAFVQFFHRQAHRQSATPLELGAAGAEARDERPNSGSRLSYALPEAIREEDPSASVIPPRQSADDYIRCFWEFVQPVFPVLHKPSFMDRYALLWSAAENDTRDNPMAEMNDIIFFSTLNIVFALGCKFSASVPFSQRASLAESFYQRSRVIYRFEILDTMSLSLVQMLLLNGIYLQSTHQANRCWNVVGLAIRNAQSLGLHVDSPKHKSQSQLSREMRRRVWHICLILDKLLSMTFGRPAMISTTWNVPFPSLIDDEYLSIEGEGKQPLDTPSSLGLCVWSSKLFLVLDDILLRLYAPHTHKNANAMTDTEASVQDIITEVSVVNRQLDAFLESLPTYLRVTTNTDTSSHFKPNVVIQQQVLHCRYLYTRILSLRPLLLLTTKYPSKFQSLSSIGDFETLDMSLVRHFSNLCVSTAVRLIDTVHQNLETSYTSSGWHSVYFTFASAIILLAAQICPAVDAESAGYSFDLSWSRCLFILEYYKDQIQAAKRAIPALGELKGQMMIPGIHDASNIEQVVPSLSAPTVHERAPVDLTGLDLLDVDSALGLWLNQDTDSFGWPDFP